MGNDREILHGAVRQIHKSGKTQMHRSDVLALCRELQLDGATFGEVARALSSEVGQTINFQGSDYGARRTSEKQAEDAMFFFGIHRGPRNRYFGGAKAEETE